MSWNAPAIDVETEFVFWRQGQERGRGRERGLQGEHVDRMNVFLRGHQLTEPCVSQRGIL